MPDIRQSKRLAVLYHITLDELAEYGYNTTDALLVLKDILARVWKGQM